MGRRNTIIENLTVGDMVGGGQCVAHHGEKAVFVRRVAPQDVVDVRVVRQRRRYAEAVPVRFRTYSPLRVEPFCEHFGTCGGCKWQHLGYESQLFYKEKQVRDALERIAHVAAPPLRPIVGSAQTQYYRNKLEYTFSNRKWFTDEEVQADGRIEDRSALGFHVPKRFDKVLDIRHCHLQPEPSNAIRLAMDAFAKAQGYAYYDLVTHQGFLRNLVIRTTTTGETMVIVIFAQPDEEKIRQTMDHLVGLFQDVTSWQYIVNQKKNDTYHDQEVICHHGRDHLVEQMEELRFRIGPKSFYQTNPTQALTLYRVVREMAGLTGQETVYDLYTGTGTIALFVAQEARRVVGVEYVPEAIDDARQNATLNGIGHADFFAGDTQALLTPDFVRAHGTPDVVITDPPRAGMAEPVVRTLAAVAPRRIVYVSCNPATQARDVALLSEHYTLAAAQPVDMFPHTDHVENVALLERKNNP